MEMKNKPLDSSDTEVTNLKQFGTSQQIQRYIFIKYSSGFFVYFCQKTCSKIILIKKIVDNNTVSITLISAIVNISICSALIMTTILFLSISGIVLLLILPSDSRILPSDFKYF